VLGSPRGLCGEDEKGSTSTTNGFDDALGGAMNYQTEEKVKEVLDEMTALHEQHSARLQAIEDRLLELERIVWGMMVGPHD
jgi:hypothetical protein